MSKVAKMTVWNVELGLSVHIEAPNGKYIVVDLGSTSTFSPIKRLWTENVGFMVITHPHLDHFSDIDNIFLARPKTLWYCKRYSSDDLMSESNYFNRSAVQQYCDFVENYTGEVSFLEDPRSIYAFDGLTANVYSTDQCDKSNKNNSSAIVVVRLGDIKIVICGDNESESLDYLLSDGSFKEAVKNADILVAPHHGRRSGFNLDFVKLVNPSLTIISDTKKSDSSASSEYSNYSKGWWTYNKYSDKFEYRNCLSTRKDGNIHVRFEDPEDVSASPSIVVTTHI